MTFHKFGSLVSSLFLILALMGAEEARADPVLHCGTHGNTTRFHCDSPRRSHGYWRYNADTWRKNLAIKLACSRDDRMQYGDKCVFRLHWTVIEAPDGWYAYTTDHDIMPLKVVTEEYIGLPRWIRQNVTRKVELSETDLAVPVASPTPRTSADPVIPSLEGGDPARSSDPEIPDL